MFLGHFGLAFAAKKVAPRPSLRTLILAAQLADGIWPLLFLLGEPIQEPLFHGIMEGAQNPFRLRREPDQRNQVRENPPSGASHA